MRIAGAVEQEMGLGALCLRTALALIFFIQMISPLCSGYEAEGIPSSFRSPQEIEKWLSGFKYQVVLPDLPQTVEETLSNKAGDCDDLARLASEALAGLGIASDVVVIKRQGVDMGHAICIWQDESGSYNFFSNKQLICTRVKSRDAAIRQFFPTAESISVLTSGELNRTV